MFVVSQLPLLASADVSSVSPFAFAHQGKLASEQRLQEWCIYLWGNSCCLSAFSQVPRRFKLNILARGKFMLIFRLIFEFQTTDSFATCGEEEKK